MVRYVRKCSHGFERPVSGKTTLLLVCTPLTRGSDIHGIIWHKVSHNRLLQYITPTLSGLVVYRSIGFLYFVRVVALASTKRRQATTITTTGVASRLHFPRLFHRDPRVLHSFRHVDRVGPLNQRSLDFFQHSGNA